MMTLALIIHIGSVSFTFTRRGISIGLGMSMKRSRKALLLSPGYYEYGDYGYSDMPAMGLMKIAGYLKSRGVNVEFMDFSIPPRIGDTGMNLKDIFNAPFARYVECGNFESEGIMKPQKYYGVPHSTIRNRIRASNPTEIWLSTGLTYYWEAARDVANICKSEFPNVPLLVGGIYASLCPQHCRDNLPADYVHVGPLDDIDDLLPDYSVDSNRCNSSIRTIQLGKGCNVNPPCSFCAVVAMDPKFKALNSNIILSYIKREYERGVRSFRFWSSQLLVPQSRIISLMKGILDAKISIKMVASEGVQPSLFTEEIARLMKDAGFVSVCIPMESIDDATVEDFRKPGDFNDYKNAVKVAQDVGFELIKSFVMIGVPGQSYNDIIKAIVDCWARDVIPALHQYTPIPGSYDWERFPQFHKNSPETLHPSLWPGASDDLKVEYLEEIKKVAAIGPFRILDYIDTEKVSVRDIWDMFVHYMGEYNISLTGPAPLSSGGYISAWRKHLITSVSQEKQKTQLLTV